MTTEEERNVRLSHRYEDLYNSDIKRFVDECYAADCVLNEGYIKGQARLLDIEERVLRAAPKRKMRVDARHAAGNDRQRLDLLQRQMAGALISVHLELANKCGATLMHRICYSCNSVGGNILRDSPAET